MKYLIGFILMFFSISSYSQNGAVVAAEKVYVSTDRFYYEPSESIYYSLFLSTDSSSEMNFSKAVKVWLINPKGNPIDSSVYYFNNNKASGAFALPAEGGPYKLKAVSIQQMNQAEPNYFEKEIFVQSYFKKSFFIQVEKDKNNYAPGDEMKLDVSFRTSGNMKMNKLPFKVQLQKGGVTLAETASETNGEGVGTVRISLPKDQSDEPYFIYISTQYKGKIESANELVPMSREKAVVQVFYENGTAGYFENELNTLVVQSRDSRGNSMDVNGELRDGKGNVLQKFSSVHKGMAQLSFNPIPGTDVFNTYFRWATCRINACKVCRP